MRNTATCQVCPSGDELTRFCRGDLPTYRLDELAEHLESCESCQSSLEQLSQTSDELLLELRDLKPIDEPADMAFDAEIAELTSRTDFFGDTLDDPSLKGAIAALPARLGEYILLEVIGRGGMGTVHRAVHTRLDKQVAIKLLSPHRLGDGAAVARFEREMRAVGRLSHPNIVSATDAGEISGAPFLVMEYVAGVDLARLIKRNGPLDPRNACEIIRQAAVGLHYAHTNGLVHRDIKPSNLLLAVAADQPSGGVVKIADLGLALLHEPDGALGATSSATLVIGSLDYMAPEQADNAHQVDRRADLYSLGCTLYELLSGRAPFALPGQTRLQKLKAHADAAVPSLSHGCPKLPTGLEPLVRKLLEKNPADRLASAEELAAALAPFAAGAGLASLVGDEPSPLRASKASIGAAQSKGRRWWGAALGCLGALVAAAVLYVQTDRGTLEIKSDDDEVKVRVEHDGKIVTVVDLKRNKEIKLRSGTYDVELGEAKDDLVLDADEITLRRGGKEVLYVRRQPPTLLHLPFDAGEAKRNQESWARAREVPDALSEAGMKLTLIPPGEFEMRPGYRVKITKPYYLGTYEVTVAQFRQFVEATGHKSDLEEDNRGILNLETGKEMPGMTWRDPELARGDDYPVAGVTWFDAERYCIWLSEREQKKYRLPTEAEWDWAARGGTTTMFAWGDNVDGGDDCEWCRDNSNGQSHPVGQKRPNAWGLYDINGNVVEWCQDWAKELPQGDFSDPTMGGPGTRALRGGSYIDRPMPLIARSAFGPAQSMRHCGFRICREL